MGTINEDLNGIKAIEDKLTSNKVANFAYTDHAYNNPLTEADGVEYYDPDSEQNIPVADASIMNVNETVLSKGWRSQASSLTRMLMNHFLGRVSYNLNKLNDNVSSLLSTLISHIGSADGIAPLNSSGLLDIDKGGTNASTVNGARENLNINNVVNTGDSAIPVSGGTTKFTTGGAYTELAKKQDNLTFDTAPTNGSSNPVISGGIYNALSNLGELKIDNTKTDANLCIPSGNNKVALFCMTNGTNLPPEVESWRIVLLRCECMFKTNAFIGYSQTLITNGNNMFIRYSGGNATSWGSWKKLQSQSITTLAFSTSTSYSVGAYCIYNDTLYRCTVAHSGAWNASHFTAVTVGGELENKADKVSEATNNDIAILDANGNLKDSGISVADLTSITAPLFSTTATYAVGDYVIYSGNLYRCTEAHSAGAWNASHFTQVTVGSELENKADNSSLAVPSDAALHYSFDDLPDYPDGTADVRLLDNNTYDIQNVDAKFRNNSGTTFSSQSGNLKVTITGGEGGTGCYIQSTSIYNKIIKLKISITEIVGNLRIVKGNDLYLQATEIGLYEIEKYIDTSNGLFFYCTGVGNSCTFTVEQIYIGDGLYSTPIIDNANGQWNSINQSGVAIKGVNGKGFNFPNANKQISVGYSAPSSNNDITISLWLNISSNYDSTGTASKPIVSIGQFLGLFGFVRFQNIIKFVMRDSVSEKNISVTMDKGKWHLYTSVYNKTTHTFTLYVDGIKVGTSPTIVSDYNFGSNITVWRIWGNNTVQGTTDSVTNQPATIDDLLIFDRALSEEEVTALYLNKANTPKFYDMNNYVLDNTDSTPTQDSTNLVTSGGVYTELAKKSDTTYVNTELAKKVDKTTTINGHALSDNVTVTKGDVGLGSVVNTGDSAVPVSGGTTKFTTGGAFNFFGRNTDAESWLSKAFGWAMGRYWNTCNQGEGDLIVTLDRTVYTIYHANNLWVAGSDSGIIWSEDAELWHLVNNTATYDFKHIYYANGIWVACSESHGLWWSTDGKTWTQGDGVNTNYSFNHVYYANGIWVACSESHGLWWSTNGKTWTQGTGSNIATYTFNDVYYGNNIWVAGSDSHGLWWSSDGKAWTQGTGSNTATYTFNSVRYADYIWVAGSDSHGLWWSSDGKAWNSSNISSSTVTISYIYYANGMWQACGEDRMLYSYDGKSFKSEYNPFLADCRSVYYANGTWVAGTDKGLIWSINGKNWQLGKGYERGGYSQCQFLCVYFAKNYWLAGGIHDSANFVQGFWYSDFDLVELKD